MLSKNFYKKLQFLIKKKASFLVIFYFILDRIKHPFQSFLKKKLKHQHQEFLKKKKTSTDYFSMNAFYWHSILKKNFTKFSYLEIGSWEGNSALFILKNFNTKKVCCVDIWDNHNEEFKEDYKNFDEFNTSQKTIFENFKFNISEFTNRLLFVKKKSDDFFKDNKDNFDVVYIDGWHEGSQVYRDLVNSWNNLNKNGIIICDDYFYGFGDNLNNYPAFKINEFIKERKNELKILCVNNVQIFIKKI